MSKGNYEEKEIYNKLKQQSIDLLNNLLKPRSQGDEGTRAHDERPKDKARDEPSDEPSDDAENEVNKKVEIPERSSSNLEPNGRVQTIDDLILFLLKSPVKTDIKQKLNDVYKIFNSTSNAQNAQPNNL